MSSPTSADDARSVGAPPASDGGSARRTFAPDFLTELFRNPLDPGYSDAAARKARDTEPTGVRGRARRSAAVVTLILLGFLFAVAYQRTVADEPARSQARAGLIEQVKKRRDETGRLQGRVDQLSAAVAALRERELGGAALAQLHDLELATGLSRVRGSGAKITVGDGPTPVDPLTGERNTAGRVKDTDLQLAANALWSSGAEAIAINGQRLTATSTIRQAGEAILVDLRPVSAPYQVIAIGPDDLAKRFREGYAGAFFAELAHRYGMSFEATEAHDQTLEAATELKLRVARPVPPSPSPSAVGTPTGSLSPGPASNAATPHRTTSEGG